MSQTKPSHSSDLAAIDAHPLREMFRIALPAVLTMSSVTAMQFVDKLFVKELGPDALAAAGNGGVAAFVLMAAVIGVLGIINTYVSQNLGAGRPERGAAYAWNGLWLVGILWLLLLLPAAAALPGVMHLVRQVFRLEAVGPRVVEMESVYGRILLAGSLFTIGGRAIHSYFYGMHRPVVVAVSVCIGQTVNIVLTWLLVFGKFGFPAWGVAGSAVGTVVGACCEFAIPFAVFLSPRFDTPFGTRGAWRFSRARVRDIVRLGWPGGAQFGNELVCWWLFMTVLAAGFGVASNAAGHIAMQYMHISFMPAVGISIALTAIVGKCMGAGRPDLAAKRTWLGMKVSMAYMGFCGIGFVVFRTELISLFRGGEWTPAEAEEVMRVGSRILILAAIFQLFDGMGMSLVGALRGAGDAVWPSVATMILSWTIIVGFGAAMTKLAPELGALGPWTAAALYIVLLGVTLLWRFMSGAWKSIKVLAPEPGLAAAGAGMIGPMAESEEAAIEAAERLAAPDDERAKAAGR